MDPSAVIPIGTCSYGPLRLSMSTKEENKFGISIIEYDGSKPHHTNLIVCKTTSQYHDKLWPGEFLLSDLFGYGPTKVQPFNIARIQKTRMPSHNRKGVLGSMHLPKFEMGLKIALARNDFDAREKLDLADSWESLLSL
jgi:hypothetical protein